MKDKEREDVQAKRGAPAVETKVALDALAVYVNASNPLTEISIPALRGVYLGDTKGWKAVGGPDHAIILYGRENNSGTYGYFKEHVLGNKDFAAATQTLAGTSAVANAMRCPSSEIAGALSMWPCGPRQIWRAVSPCLIQIPSVPALDAV